MLLERRFLTSRADTLAFAQRFSVNFLTIYRKVQHETLNLRQEVYTRYEDQSGKMSSPDLGLELDILITFTFDKV